MDVVKIMSVVVTSVTANRVKNQVKIFTTRLLYGLPTFKEIK